MKNILIVYYSRKGENYYGGTLKNLTKGNTEIAAEYIQKAVGGTLFEVETVKTYPAAYHDCTREAKAETLADARPEVRRYAENMDAYDTVFVGFPNWCKTMPMCLFTFLEHYDLSGKTIIPFVTHEGSGIANSVSDLKRICRGAEVLPGLAVYGHQVRSREAEIAAWARQSLGL